MGVLTRPRYQNTGLAHHEPGIHQLILFQVIEMSKTTDMVIDQMNCEFTTSDFRLAIYWEHYEAGGAFDDCTPEEYASLEALVNRVWQWCETHTAPVFDPPLAP